MNKREVSELFGVMLLGWPNAEMFKGGIAKLGPTIELWSACVADVDFWTGQQAVIMLCKECKFPPTIAEFREKVDKVNNAINNEFTNRMGFIKMRCHFGDSLIHAYNDLPQGDFMRKAIDAVGGPDKILTEDGKAWRYYEIRDAYIAAVKQSATALEGARARERLPPTRKMIGGENR